MFTARFLVRRLSLIRQNAAAITQCQPAISCSVVTTKRFISHTHQRHTPQSLNASESSLQIKITKLRKHVTKNCSIPSLQALDSIITDIEKGEIVLSADIHFLIASCESADNAKIEERRKYMERIIQFLEVNHKLDVDHYNRILQFHSKQPNVLDVCQLIDRLTERNIQTSSETRNLLRKYLQFHLFKRHATQSDRILRELLATEPLNKYSFEKEKAQVIQLHIEAGNLSKAIELYGLSKSHDNQFRLNNNLIAELVKSLIDSGDIRMATEYIFDTTKDDGTEHPERVWKPILRSLVGKVADKEYLSIFDKMVSQNLLIIDGFHLWPLINQHLVNDDDLDKALDLVYEIAREYRCMPGLQTVLVKLIERKAVDHLERTTETALDLYGNDCLYELAGAFLECNRIPEAQNIFKQISQPNPSFHFRSMVTDFYQKKQFENLERLLSAAEDYIHIDDRNFLLEMSILANCQRYSDSPDRILADCEKLTSTPAEDTLKKLKFFLEKHKRQLPAKWINSLPPADNKTAYGTDFHKLIESNEIEQAKEIVRQALRSEGELKIHRESLRFLLATCARNGDVSFMTELRPQLDDYTKFNLSFEKFDCRAHINADQCDEYLTLMGDRARNVRGYQSINDSRKGFPAQAYEILKWHPDRCDKFEEMAELYEKKNIIKPMCMLWLYHLSQDNVTECKRLYRHYGLLDDVLCKQGCDLYYRAKNPKLYETLIESLDQQRLKKGTLAYFYRKWLNVLLENNYSDEIAAVLKRAFRCVSRRDIGEMTLDKIRFGGDELSEARAVLASKQRK